MSSSDATKAEGLSHIENKLDERGVAPTQSSTTTSTTGDGTTVIGTIKSYLGFSSDASTDPASGSTTLPDRTREPTLGELTNENITPSAANASFDGSGDTKGAASEDLASTTANESFESTGPSGLAASENLAPTEANKSFDAPSTSAGILPDPSTDSSVTGTEPTATGSANEKPIEAEESSGAAKELVSVAGSKALERPDAIPTAGGEKLGQKHWGESKVVPADPKPHKEEAGVESKAGQPTAEVQDNTSKNTGGATGGPHGHGSGESAATTTTTTATSSESVGKEKLTDKIKDKLHIGKK